MMHLFASLLADNVFSLLWQSICVINCNCFRPVFVSKSNGQCLISFIFAQDLFLIDLCGSCKLIRNCLLYWYGYFIYSYLLLCIFFVFVNICLEILINLRIYLVFMWISLCILWNLWISVVNLQHSALNPSKLSVFNLFLKLLHHLCHCRIQVVRGVSLQNCQFRSLLNSKLVNYSILQYLLWNPSRFSDFIQYFVGFHSKYCEIHGFK